MFMCSKSLSVEYWVLIFAVVIANPFLIVYGDAESEIVKEGFRQHDLMTQAATLVEEPQIENLEILEGQYFVSPLTEVHYLIVKDLEEESVKYCRVSGAFCYRSVQDILKEEAASMPKWMLKVSPALRRKVVKLTSQYTSPQAYTRLVVELEDETFRSVANRVWDEKLSEIEGLTSSLSQICSPHHSRQGQPKEESEPRSQAILQDECRDQAQEDRLLIQLDGILDDSRREIYYNSEEILAPVMREVVDSIEVIGGNVFSHTVVLPALFVVLPLHLIPELASIDGVRRISEDEAMEFSMDISAYAMEADEWWSAGYTGGVWDLAVVDTGIDGSHPALTVDRASVFHLSAIFDLSYGDDIFSTDDFYGHGTHIAGTVASADSTYRGVAYGMDSLINAKAGYAKTSGGAGMMQTDGMSAVDWAISTAGADVVTLSFGGNPGEADSSYARFYDAVVDGLGISVAVSAGNSGPSSTTITRPGNAYNVLTVGNMDDRNTRSTSDDSIRSSSSRGPTGDGRLKPDIVAPGTWIRSTNSRWETEADFVDMSGTSMAAPHIAASVILLMDHRGKVFPPIYKALLLNTADDWGISGPDNTYGWGYVDLWEAYFNRNDVFDGYVDDDYPNYQFYKGPIFAGEKATLVWNRHVDYLGGFFPITYYGLNDIDLYSFDESDNSLVDFSVSSINNVEQVVADADYASVVYKVQAFGTYSGVSQEHYGLALEEGFIQALPPSLSTTLTVPFSAEIGDTFSISATVWNTGGIAAHNVFVNLILPPGVTLIAGGLSQNLGRINAGTSEVAIWQVRGDLVGLMDFFADATSNCYWESFSSNLNSGSVNIIDTTPPTSAVNPLPAFETIGQFSITATATDLGAIDHVTLYYDRDGAGWTLYSATWAFPWEWNFDSRTTGGDGFYQFYTTATDASTNTEQPPNIPDAYTWVDTTSPSSIVEELPTYETSVAFPVIAIASDSTTGVFQVELYSRHEGGSWSSQGIDVSSPWSWTFDSFQAGGDGLYDYYSIATDTAGNVELSPSMPDTTTIVDTLNPTSTVNPLQVYQITQAFNVTAIGSDETSGVSEIDLFYRRDSGPWMRYSNDTAPPWIWDFNTTSTGGNGFYEFFSRAIDKAGNMELLSNLPQASTTVDTIKPLSHVEQQTEYTASDSFLVLASGSDLNGISLIELWFSLDGGPWTLYDVCPTSTCSWDFHSLNVGGNGDYRFYSRAYDGVNNYEDAPSIPDTTTTVDTVEPIISISNPMMDEWFTANNVEIEWMGHDEGSGLSFFEVSLGGVQWVNTGRSTRIGFVELTEGTHTVYVRAYDKAGNYGSANVNFGVDTKEPTLEIMSPEDESRTTSPFINVVWDASDSTSGIDHYEIRIDKDAFIDCGLNTTHRFDGVEDGVHKIIVKAVDKAGNYMEQSVMQTVDTFPYWLIPIIILIMVLLLLMIILQRKRRRKRAEYTEIGRGRYYNLSLKALTLQTRVCSDLMWNVKTVELRYYRVWSLFLRPARSAIITRNSPMTTASRT
jgi:uncharacterized repeat protein (TIGR01451 family)